MSHVKIDTHISIPSHARLVYDLKGSELTAYGLIHGFSKDGKSWFVGGLQYVADWCGLSNKQRALEVVNRLIEKGCIRKRETEICTNLKKCDYQAVIPIMEIDTPLLKEQRPIAEKDTGVAKKATSNINDNIGDSIIVEDNSSRIINNTSNNSSSTRKNSKKEFDLSFVNIAFEDVFNEWLEYKRARHEMYKTQKSLEMCYSKLLKFSNNDPHTAQEIIESAIGNNYSGFFELKTNINNGQRKQQEPESIAQQLARRFSQQGGFS